MKKKKKKDPIIHDPEVKWIYILSIDSKREMFMKILIACGE